MSFPPASESAIVTVAQRPDDRGRSAIPKRDWGDAPRFFGGLVGSSLASGAVGIPIALVSIASWAGPSSDLGIVFLALRFAALVGAMSAACCFCLTWLALGNAQSRTLKSTLISVPVSGVATLALTFLRF